MVRSILDTDLYKFTTSFAYMKMFPNAICTFTYIDRNRVKRTKEFLEKLKKAFKDLENVRLTEEEFEWCTKNESISFIPQYYWEWLKSFRYDSNKIKCWLDEDDVLNITVTDKCYKCTLYEIPCLFLVPEINNQGKNINWDKTIGEKLIEKINFANDKNISFSEFGSRRRYNYEVQDKVINVIKNNSKTCVGTSNVHFAMKYGMKPIGTHPHEWFMFHGAQFGYNNENYLALEHWQEIFQGDLGIALTDTLTSDVFFENFSLKHAKLFDGIRQDSGDEYKFTDKAIVYYKSKGIDTLSKTIIFSNGLDFYKAYEIKKYCDDKIKCSFGIGTNLTCDVYDIDGNKVPYENQVMKMTTCAMSEHKPIRKCIKISDDKGKHMGDIEEIRNASYNLNIKIA